MTNEANIFGTAIRLVECDHCGAPVTARLTGEHTSCSYCGRHVIVGARPDDHERSETAAEEVARLRQLASQQQVSVGRDRYDLSDVPRALRALGVSADSSTKTLRIAIEKLKRRDDVDAQLGLVWVAVEGARRWHHLGKLDKARARLETSLEWVSDPGYRDLLRCELIRFAVRAKEIDAAESWLEECTSAPIVLELDSAHRYARTLIALAYGDVGKAERCLGVEDEMPVAPSHVSHFALARAQCATLRRNFAEADRMVRAKQEHLVELLEVSRRDDLVTDLVTRVTDEWKEQSRRIEGKALYRKADQLAFSLLYSRCAMRVFFYAGWLALGLGLLFGCIHSMVDDELLTRHVIYPLCGSAAVTDAAGETLELAYQSERVLCPAAAGATHPVAVRAPSSWRYLYFFAGYAPIALPLALLIVSVFERRGRAARHQREKATEREVRRLLALAGRRYRGLRTTSMERALLALGALPIFVGALSLWQSLL